MKTCLLLSGWSGSGKDAVCVSLEELYGAKRLAFADYLKRLVSKQYRFPVEWAYSIIGKRTMLPCGQTVREVLVTEGQRIREQLDDPELFARHVAKQILADKTTQIFCITDWRLPIEHAVLEKVCFENEIRLLKVRIRREGQLQSEVDHPETEQALERWVFDIYLTNPGTTIPALKEVVQSKFDEFMDRKDTLSMNL